MAPIHKDSQNKLAKKRLKRQIEEGRITSEIRSLLKKELISAKEIKPNSWDFQFIKSMIDYSEILSLSQKQELERILQDQITVEDGFEF